MVFVRITSSMIRGVYCLGHTLQLLSTCLGVQVVVVLLGVLPPVPVQGTRNHNEQNLALESPETVEEGVVHGVRERLLSIRRHRVGGDALLLGGAEVAPPAHVCLCAWTAHYYYADVK